MKKDRLSGYFYGIQKKLLLLIMLLIFLMMLLITAAVSLIMGKNVQKDLTEQYEYINDRFYRSFQGMYENLEVLTDNCITNQNVQNSLKNMELSAYDKEVISKTLQFVADNNIDSYLYMDNKDNVYTRNSRHVDVKRLKNSYLYQGLGTEYSKVKLFWEDSLLSDTEEKVLYAGRYVRPIEREYPPGVIYLRLDAAVFDAMTADARNDNPAYFLLDSKGKICFQKYPKSMDDRDFSPVEQEIQTLYGKTDEALTRGFYGKRGLIYIQKHEESGFAVATFVPNKVVYQVLWQTLRMIWIIFFIVLILAFFLSRIVAEKITKPIRYISNLMENFDDSRLNDLAVLETHTELDEIGLSYNRMLGHISELLTQVTYKERELRKAEMDTLLYQIHPHFLYNTLDTVYMLARISREETIMRMVQALSQYLRINLSNGAEKISIAEELRHVKAYLDIQNIRKDNLFSYSMEVEPGLEKLPVIKMILQPVAENCIKHAFEEDGEDLKIWITVRAESDMIVFRIENNGAVMEEKEKERLNRLESVEISAIDTIITKSKGGFGVWNVVKRLRLAYQEQIRFYYEMSYGKTSCIIKIKRELMEADERETNRDSSSDSSIADEHSDERLQ
ncbi:MAG: histidine kinase [Lachnospiraceae bacterium]|nr:histidine kinase [Lachnospiraceae bacterium]